MVASHTPPMRPGRGREAPPGRQGGSGVPGGVSGPRRSTGGTRARSGGGLDRRPAPLNRGRARRGSVANPPTPCRIGKRPPAKPPSWVHFDWHRIMCSCYAHGQKFDEFWLVRILLISFSFKCKKMGGGESESTLKPHDATATVRRRPATHPPAPPPLPSIADR